MDFVLEVTMNHKRFLDIPDVLICCSRSIFVVVAGRRPHCCFFCGTAIFRNRARGAGYATKVPNGLGEWTEIMMRRQMAETPPQEDIPSLKRDFFLTEEGPLEAIVQIKLRWRVDGKPQEVPRISWVDYLDSKFWRQVKSVEIPAAKDSFPRLRMTHVESPDLKTILKLFREDPSVAPPLFIANNPDGRLKQFIRNGYQACLLECERFEGPD